jgi:hypothetical protein
MQTQKEVTFEIEEGDTTKKYSVVMKRLNYGDKTDLEKESSEIRIYNGVPDAKIDLAKLKVLSIMKSIVNSDYPNLKDYNTIRSLPQEVGELLFEAYTELNTTSLKKND